MDGATARTAPPLPPRRPSTAVSHMDEPPPYEAVAHQQKAFEKASACAGLAQNDPRSSSQDSLVPEEGTQQQRRKLLLVYIHGFMGAETSFRSFPAHVHNLLTVLLSETHVVHTKVYPRYASRGKISIARDDFGKWIEPHQDATTDLVLLGHSMGGLLSAEVVLAPAIRSGSGPFRHRILGTINFDVPFLGMHPGVVKSGLASIFKPAEEPRDQDIGGGSHTSSSEGSQGESRPQIPSPTPSAQRVDTLWAPGKQDPNYNPSFANDVVLPVRKGWRNAWHFINKHSDDLTQATKKLVSSHLEFGGAMANYGELKSRYARVRALEEVDARVRQSVVEGGVPPRVRFVNYYTASTGRFKKPKSPPRESSRSQHGSRSLSPADYPPDLHARTSTDSIATRRSDEEQWEEAMESMTVGDAAEAEGVLKNNTAKKADQASMTIPDLPVKPPAQVDFSYIQDPEIKKLVQREHDKAVKAYEEAIVERERLLSGSAAYKGKQRQLEDPVHQSRSEEPRGRPAVSHERAKKPESEMTHSEREYLRLEKEQHRMEREGRRMRGERSPEPGQSSNPDTIPMVVTPPRESSPRPSTTASTVDTSFTYDQSSLAPAAKSMTSVNSKEESHKPRKDRMFCTLPPKDANGERDPRWVRVFMENVDEVGAHCGLFFVDERYERLVGDVASRIEGWVNDETGNGISKPPSQPQKW